MALSRSWLSALGIEDAKVDEIVKAHSESLNGLRQERDELREQLKRIPEMEKQLEAQEKAAKESGNEWAAKYKGLEKEFGDYKAEHDRDGDLQQQLDALRTEYDAYKKDVTEKAETASKREAYKALLGEIGVANKFIPSILKVTDLASIKLDKDGKIEDADKLKADNKESYADFIVKTRQEGASTATPPGGGTTGMTKEQIIAIQDPVERQQKIAENHELFGI